MAEEKQQEDQVQDAPKETKPARQGSKNLIIVVLILLVALGGGAAAYVLVFNTGTAESRKEEKKNTKTALIALDPFVLNLSEHGRFLKVTMQLEIADAAQQQSVAEKIPQLRDAIITLVSSKSAESVSSPEGKFQLKDELLLRANQAIGKAVMFKNLYFTEFVMQ